LLLLSKNTKKQRDVSEQQSSSIWTPQSTLP
jgi:hypothetical protein